MGSKGFFGGGQWGREKISMSPKIRRTTYPRFLGKKWSNFKKRWIIFLIDTNETSEKGLTSEISKINN